MEYLLKSPHARFPALRATLRLFVAVGFTEQTIPRDFFSPRAFQLRKFPRTAGLESTFGCRQASLTVSYQDSPVFPVPIKPRFPSSVGKRRAEPFIVNVARRPSQESKQR